MDPALQPLLAPLTTLRGVGPALAEKIARAAGGGRVLDLLFHMPEGYLDRSNMPLLADAKVGEVATLRVEVVSVEEGAPPRPWKVVVRDRSGFGEVAFFGHRPPAVFQKGAVLAISGKVDRFSGRVQLRNPDRVGPVERLRELAGLEPIWPLTAGLFPGQVRLAIVRALAVVPELAEWHDPALIRREGWPGFKEALCAVHTPTRAPGDGPRARLAYDELLAHQVAMGRCGGRRWRGSGLRRRRRRCRRWRRSMRIWRRRCGCCGCCRGMWGRARR